MTITYYRKQTQILATLFSVVSILLKNKPQMISAGCDGAYERCTLPWKETEAAGKAVEDTPRQSQSARKHRGDASPRRTRQAREITQNPQKCFFFILPSDTFMAAFYLRI